MDKITGVSHTAHYRPTPRVNFALECVWSSRTASTAPVSRPSNRLVDTEDDLAAKGYFSVRRKTKQKRNVSECWVYSTCGEQHDSELMIMCLKKRPFLCRPVQHNNKINDTVVFEARSGRRQVDKHMNAASSSMSP